MNDANRNTDDIRSLLVQCRTERNLSLAQVAKAVKLTTAGLSNIEAGKSKPRRTTRLRIVNFLQKHGYFAREAA